MQNLTQKKLNNEACVLPSGLIFGPKVVKMVAKWKQSRTFSYDFSVHFCSPRTDLLFHLKPHDCPNLSPLLTPVPTRDFKFGIQIVSDWRQMGQIWDFLRSDSVHFGAGRQNILKLILKSPRFVPFGANTSQ